MNLLFKVIKNAYEGSYFLHRKYEPNELSHGFVKVRVFVIFLLYYFAVYILAVGFVVNKNGPYKVNKPFTVFIFLSLYLAIYFLIINPIISDLIINEDIEEVLKKRKINNSVVIFIGGIISFLASCFLVYILYRK